MELYSIKTESLQAREVKWALESITTNKASGGDGIPVELFQILKDDAASKRRGAGVARIVVLMSSTMAGVLSRARQLRAKRQGSQ